jgi:hypothetical protein
MCLVSTTLTTTAMCGFAISTTSRISTARIGCPGRSGVIRTLTTGRAGVSQIFPLGWARSFWSLEPTSIGTEKPITFQSVAPFFLCLPARIRHPTAVLSDLIGGCDILITSPYNFLQLLKNLKI